MVKPEIYESDEALNEVIAKIRKKFCIAEGERWTDFDEDRLTYEIGLGDSPANVRLVKLALEALDKNK